MLVAFASNERITDVRKFPISYYCELVNQGINKGNLCSGGGFEKLTIENKIKIEREKRERKIKEYREGKWQKK